MITTRCTRNDVGARRAFVECGGLLSFLSPYFTWKLRSSIGRFLVGGARGAKSTGDCYNGSAYADGHPLAYWEDLTVAGSSIKLLSIH